MVRPANGPLAAGRHAVSAVSGRWQRIEGSADRWQKRHAWLAFPYAVGKRFSSDQAGNLAALIAYYAFFSIFPLLLVFVTVLGFALHGHPQLEERVLGSALGQFPIIGGRVGAQLHGLHGSVLGLTVGLLGALWGGLGVANSAQNALNTVWGVPREDRPGALARTLRSLLVLLVGGAGILVTTVVNGLSTGSRADGVTVGLALRLAAGVIGLLANTALFTAGFIVLTARDIGIREVWPGALLAAVFWQLLELLGGYFVAHALAGASQTYGTFALVIGLLSWFYLQAQLTLVAAEVNVVRALGLWSRRPNNHP